MLPSTLPIQKHYKTIPVYSVPDSSWSERAFETRKEFVAFLWSHFKEPGLYEFDDCTEHFNIEARRFVSQGYFCRSVKNSKDFIAYWDGEKQKCREGVLIIGREGKSWYLTRDYYMWINFLPIYHKEKKDFLVAEIRDAQYHMALYEDIAEHSYQHCAILKKRQIASSYFHAAKMINRFWFENGFVNKMAGTLKTYINNEGTWRFLEEYRNFLNQHTAWIRPCNPSKVLNWQQKIEHNQGGIKVDKGNKSVIVGLVLDKDVTNGVGGPCGLFFHEEAGIAPKMNETLEYLLPALKSGMVYTGMAVMAGSVGKLDQCEPLKQMILHPKSKDILAVPTNLMDSKGTKGECALFIPQQWSMIPYIDRYGNSIIHAPTPTQLPDLLASWLDMGHAEEDFDPKCGALLAIERDREEKKREKEPGDYQLYLSQQPTNIEEAFASRTVSDFPQHLVVAQIERIQDKQYKLDYYDIVRTATGPEFRETKARPIDTFPIAPGLLNKEGAIVVHEKPVAGSAWGTYVASIDPVGAGKTTTSDSLCSIYIYKNDVDVYRTKADGTREHVREPGKLVAWWCGRFDDLNKTHERCSLLLEIYQAQAIYENNVPAFIPYMIEKRRQKFLIRKDQLYFLKELSANTNVFQEYGWKNVGNIFKVSMVRAAAAAMAEELYQETDAEGNITFTRFGIERFPDIMLMREAQAYYQGLNVDRLIAFCALMAYLRTQRANRGKDFQRVEKVESLQNQAPAPNLPTHRSPFRHIGHQQQLASNAQRHGKPAPGPTRSPFKNLR